VGRRTGRSVPAILVNFIYSRDALSAAPVKKPSVQAASRSSSLS
jgi:hypothetical protein